jgi:hypothetical protein
LSIAHTKSFLFPADSVSPGASNGEQMPLFLMVIVEIKVPAIEIAGLCLPLKPQKEILYAE